MVNTVKPWDERFAGADYKYGTNGFAAAYRRAARA
jgi:hypothetical protein